MNNSSFLRWAGSKKKLIPVLKEYWGDGYNRYIEPFMGSAKLFFSLTPQKAVLGDINHFLIEAYTQIKKNPYEVYQILKEYKVNEKEYYLIRSLNPNKLGINQRAARFIYLNRFCFNGLYRTNLNGEFNVPFSGESTWDIELEFQKLKDASKKLSSVKLCCGDFEKVIVNNLKEGDFVYLDPPYAVENRKIFKQYGPSTFGISDLQRLSELLFYIDAMNSKFLLSYAYCKEANALFKYWGMEKKFTQRNIAGFSKYRRKAAELLVTNIK